MKTVTYLGEQFKVPDWANYVAADSDRTVYAYESLPEFIQRGTYWSHTNIELKRCRDIGTVNIATTLIQKI